MKVSNTFLWLLQILLSLFLAIASYHFFISTKIFTSVLFLTFSILLIISAFATISKEIGEVDKIIFAIQKKDFSLFPKNERGKKYKNRAVDLYYQAKAENKQLESYKLLYENILDRLEIGMMILSQEKNVENWSVFYCNPEFLQILKVPKYFEWNFYETKIPKFYRLIQETNYSDQQSFLEISIDESSSESYSLRTSRINTPQKNYFVISLESVQRIVEKKEKLAWNNLMKVISHELLNTLTPINSLINNLEFISGQEKISEDDHEEMRESLKVISSKSTELVKFVNDYRQIAELPQPQKTRFSLLTCLENVLSLFQHEFRTENVFIEKHLSDYQILADKNMLERVFVNLILNAMYALENENDKKIIIKTATHNKRMVISFEDNGIGINDQIKDKIFLPFFTTRPHGSGIGLTLSKSILEAHGGYLTFKNLEKGCVFEVWMVL